MKEIEMEKEERKKKIICKALSAISLKIRRKIGIYILKNKRATFGELRLTFNLNNNTLRFHLGKLQEAYIVSQSESRFPYELTEFGEKIMNIFEGMEKVIDSIIKEKLEPCKKQ